jgi:hypothetical protein
MTSAERFELIDRYKQGYAEVTRALAGIAPEELDWKPAKSEWSAREVVWTCPGLVDTRVKLPMRRVRADARTFGG